MFGGRGSIQLARISGIRIGATPSWFVVLFGLIYVLTGYFDDILVEGGSTSFALAVAASLLFFASIVVHELGHAIVARRNGIATAGIELFFFGGVARLSRDPDTPGGEFRVAAAGPAVTVAIIALCLGGSVIATHADQVIDSARFLDTGERVTPAEALLGWLTAVNVYVLALNLIPALPLDGGRIARAITWRITGNRARATRLAARAGQGLAYMLMAGGLVLLVTVDPISGLWLIILGVFVNQSARAELLSSALTQRIEGITVADIMDREPVWIPAEATALQAQDEFVLRYHHPWYPVVEASGRYAGVLRAAQVDDAVAGGRPASVAAELLDPATEQLRIDPARPLETLLSEPSLREIGALAAVDDTGLMVGMVTIEQVRRALLAVSPGS